MSSDDNLYSFWPDKPSTEFENNLPVSGSRVSGANSDSLALDTAPFTSTGVNNSSSVFETIPPARSGAIIAASSLDSIYQFGDDTVSPLLNTAVATDFEVYTGPSSYDSIAQFEDSISSPLLDAAASTHFEVNAPSSSVGYIPQFEDNPATPLFVDAAPVHVDMNTASPTFDPIPVPNFGLCSALSLFDSGPTTQCEANATHLSFGTMPATHCVEISDDEILRTPHWIY